MKLKDLKKAAQIIRHCKYKGCNKVITGDKRKQYCDKRCCQFDYNENKR